jgi:hypothetical protein
MTACAPPLVKKSRTAKPSALSGHSPPNCRSKSANPLTTTGSSAGPRRVRPTNAVIEVATPVMACTPPLTSSM